jgi:very-short-patch-repair endonuclease
MRGSTAQAMTVEAEVARLAARQQGIVTRAQMVAAGLSRHAIAGHVGNGWLVARHRGVYQLGAFGGPFADEMAALLACGPHGVLSHWAAAALFELCSRAGRPVDVTITQGRAGRRPGIRVHRPTALPPCDVVLKHGLMVTTPARTLVDLAASTTRAELERLTEEAQVQRLASPAELLAVIARGTGRPGVRRMRSVVDSIDEPLFTRSEAEKRLRALCRSAALPLPRMNVKRAGWEVDAVWDVQRLVVEVDGYKFHSTRAKFERDRRKDADLTLAGYRVLRITWRRLTRESPQVIAILSAALSA